MSSVVSSGAENPQLPASSPSCVAAPVTRQSSFLRSPQPHAVLNHFPSLPPAAITNGQMGPLFIAASPLQRAANASQQGSHCPLPAVASPCSRAGGSAPTAQVPQGRGTVSDALLMLPELSQCPSVASAPCTTGSCRPSRHPGKTCCFSHFVKEKIKASHAKEKITQVRPSSSSAVSIYNTVCKFLSEASGLRNSL